MRLSFDSIDEVREFVKSLKGTRGGKDKEDGEATTEGAKAPPPLAPPATQTTGNVAFSPAAAPVNNAPQGGPFGGAAPVGPDPAVVTLVTRITTKLDGELAKGQNPDQATAWFRGECQKAGLDASAADLAKIKAAFLPRLPMPVLENMAKLMAA